MNLNDMKRARDFSAAKVPKPMAGKWRSERDLELRCYPPCLGAPALLPKFDSSTVSEVPFPECA